MIPMTGLIKIIAKRHKEPIGPPETQGNKAEKKSAVENRAQVARFCSRNGLKLPHRSAWRDRGSGFIDEFDCINCERTNEPQHDCQARYEQKAQADIAF